MAYAPWLMVVVEGRKPQRPNFKHYHWSTFKGRMETTKIFGQLSCLWAQV
jgi:hypothetical protein